MRPVELGGTVELGGIAGLGGLAELEAPLKVAFGVALNLGIADKAIGLSGMKSVK